MIKRITRYIICDIDGTLSNHDHRLHFLKTKDWKSFLRGMGDDPPIPATISLLKIIARTTYDLRAKIILTSGRSEDYWETTALWLLKHKVPYAVLLMRGKRDGRPDHEVKKDMLTDLRESYQSDPLFVIDDRKSVVAMWRAEGLICYQIQDSLEF